MVLSLYIVEAAVPEERVLHRGERVLRAILLLWHEGHPLHLPQEEARVLRGQGHGKLCFILCCFQLLLLHLLWIVDVVAYAVGDVVYVHMCLY